MRTVRGNIPTATRLQAAEALCRYVDALALPPQAIIAGYWPVGTELDIRPLLNLLQTRGHALALPRITAPMSPLRFYRWTPGMAMENDILGFPAPIDDVEVIPDVLLVPLLAFDKRGYRMGQGTGFYDLTLNHLRRTAKKPQRYVGIAFDRQLVDRLEVEPHDERLDAVLTETGLIISEEA